jgi:hypothetical protein
MKQTRIGLTIDSYIWSTKTGRQDHITILEVDSRIILKLMSRKLSVFIWVSLIQLLYFWTLSIVLLLFITHNVSETAFCLSFQVEPTRGLFPGGKTAGA